MKVKFPSIVSRLIGGRREVEVEASNINEAFGRLAESLGEKFKEAIFDHNGNVKRTLNIFLNGKNIRLMNAQELKLKDGDEISIIPAVGGGA